MEQLKNLSPEIIAILKKSEALQYCGEADAAREILRPFRLRGDISAASPNHVAIELEFGNTFVSVSRFIEAGKCFVQASEMAERIQDLFWLLKSKYSIARLLFFQKDFENASMRLREILKKARGNDLPGIEAWAKGLLGEISCIEMRFEESLQLHLESLKLFYQLNYIYGVAEQYSNLGRVYYNLKQLRKAEHHFKSSLELYQRIGDKDQIAIQTNNLAIIEAGRLRFDKSILLFKSALKIRYELCNYAGMANIQENIGHIEHFSYNDHSSAMNWYKRSIQSLEYIRRHIAGTFKQQEIYFAEFFEVYQKLIELLVESYFLSPSGRILEEIFEYVERAKAYVLLARIENLNSIINQEIQRDKEESGEISQLRNEINGLCGQLKKYKNPGTRKSKEIIQEKEERQMRLSELELSTALKKTGYDELCLPNAASLKSLQNEGMEKDEVILSYYVAVDRAYCLEITSSELKLYVLGAVKKLNYLIDRYVQGFFNASARSVKNYVEQNFELWRFLTADGKLMKNSHKIYIISPDAKINQVSFESLPATNNFVKPEYLGLNYQLLYQPSVSTFLTMRRNSKIRKAIEYDYDFAGFVNPDNSYFTPIADAETQGEAIKQLFHGSDDALVKGNRATKEKFKEKLGNSIRCLHIGSHAILDAGEAPDGYDCKEPAIIFSNQNDGTENFLLTASEIFEMKIRAKIVTLSACVTGTGAIIRGEGANSLARAFLAAGAQCVVASLWPIWSHISRDFMIQFYEGMLSKSIAEAFFEAKKLMAAARPVPADWAAFVVVGDGRQILF